MTVRQANRPCTLNKLLRLLALLVPLWLCAQPLAAAEPTALDRVKAAGVLKVAFYNNLAPFSYQGKGVDVDIAAALAAKLGLKLSPLWFDADENMDDDLRNMVWKGHYLGYGPADVMIHAPVNARYMNKIDKVRFFAPYHRERYAVGWLKGQHQFSSSLEPLAGITYAAEGDTLAASVMLGLDGGRYRESLKVYRSGREAVAALANGEVTVAFAQMGELEAGLKGMDQFAIDLPPEPVMKKNQWAIGLAVKKENEVLARALQQAMNELMADGSIDKIMRSYGVKHRRP